MQIDLLANIKCNIYYFVLTIFIIAGCKISKGNKNSSCGEEFNTLINDVIYLSPDTPPVFSKGYEYVIRYISENILISPNSSIKSAFVVEVIIDNKGIVKHVGILSKNQNGNEYIKRKGVDLLTDSENQVIDIIYGMPEWEPAKCGNQNVNAKVRFPIRLMLH